MSSKIVGFAVSVRSGEPQAVWFEEGDSIEVALQGLESIAVDPDSIAALSGSRGVAKAVAVPWQAIFAPQPKQ